MTVQKHKDISCINDRIPYKDPVCLVEVRWYWSGVHSTRHTMDSRHSMLHARIVTWRDCKSVLLILSQKQLDGLTTSPGNGSFCFTPWSTPKIISPPVCPLCAVSAWVYVCVLQPRSIYGLILSSRLSLYISLRLYTGWPAINQHGLVYGLWTAVMCSMKYFYQYNAIRAGNVQQLITLRCCLVTRKLNAAFILKWYLNVFACTTYVKWIHSCNTQGWNQSKAKSFTASGVTRISRQLGGWMGCWWLAKAYTT